MRREGKVDSVDDYERHDCEDYDVGAPLVPGRRQVFTGSPVLQARRFRGPRSVYA